MKEFTSSKWGCPALKYLSDRPTLSQGQDADLKIDDGTERHWLSRCSDQDGQDWPVLVERLRGGRWVSVGGYGDWTEWHALKENN